MFSLTFPTGESVMFLSFPPSLTSSVKRPAVLSFARRMGWSFGVWVCSRSCPPQVRNSRSRPVIASLSPLAPARHANVLFGFQLPRFGLSRSRLVYPFMTASIPDLLTPHHTRLLRGLRPRLTRTLPSIIQLIRWGLLYLMNTILQLSKLRPNPVG
jgi:hypothetical protein